MGEGWVHQGEQRVAPRDPIKFPQYPTSDKFNNSNQGSQFRATSNQMELSNTNIKKQQTWWETESKLFGVPHGLSA